VDTDRRMMLFWANNTIDVLKRLNVGDLNLVKDNSRLADYIDLISKLEDDELVEIFKDFKNDLYHILYAKQQPPDNLMEGNTTDVDS